MPWLIRSDRPVYIQLMEEIQNRIFIGQYLMGDRLPSVRDLAEEAKVNPNTMQKALSELESSGLIISQRTSGRYVTDDKLLINEMKLIHARSYVNDFLTNMKRLGLSDEDIRQLISNNKEG